MLSAKNIIRLSVFMGILTWVSLVIVDLIIVFGQSNNLQSGFPAELKNVLLILFFVFLYLFYKYRIGKAEGINFIDQLWRVFVTGLLSTVVSLFIKFFFLIFEDNPFTQNPTVVNFLYLVNMGLVSAFLVSTFIVWKRLILYQKSKRLLQLWNVFEYAVGTSMIISLFQVTYGDMFFFVTLAILAIYAAMLSVNLKWVAYLNFKQKWKSILLIVLVIMYLGYFLVNLVNYRTSFVLVTDLIDHVFVLALFIFCFLYSLFSLLVILFNLPTSSVFEQKIDEAMSFQRLSQSISAGQNVDQVYSILLESAASAVFANAAWLEIQNGAQMERKTYDIDASEIDEISTLLEKSRVKEAFQGEMVDDDLRRSRHITSLKHPRFKSAMVFPLQANNRETAALVLLKDVQDGFNQEMMNIVRTFTSQASISIENFHLINEAIANERYKEELNIAKRVQRNLLPGDLETSKAFEMAAVSESASDVGGDYYESYRIADDNVAVIIADVSGKGTSAAFHMSLMKGIFHSLVPLGLPPGEFLSHANTALSNCLDKKSFVTATLLSIRCDLKEVRFTRAGHCPTLFYNADAGKAMYMEDKGLGLGIVRNNSFPNYVKTSSMHYASGDIILLFTDGVTEATNPSGKEFGYDNLLKIVETHASKPAAKLVQALKQALFDHCGGTMPADDYTLLAIKFM